MKKTTITILLLILFFTSGCSQHLTSELVPDAQFNELGKTFVVHFEPDRRRIDSVIADQLSLMGYPATYGEKSEIPENVDTLVTYKDKWQWDLVNYMLQLNIQFRDGMSQKLIVTGESYRTSLVSVSSEKMVRETLEEMFRKNDTPLTHHNSSTDRPLPLRVVEPDK